MFNDITNAAQMNMPIIPEEIKNGLDMEYI